MLRTAAAVTEIIILQPMAFLCFRVWVALSVLLMQELVRAVTFEQIRKNRTNELSVTF